MPRQVDSLRKVALIAAALTVSALTVPAMAAEPSVEAGTYLEQQILRKVPPNWQVHVSRRGDDLIAFFMPPYQEAFDLWYEPGRLQSKMMALCPSGDDAIWQKLAPEQNIKLEPTVGGKSADAMQLTCPRDQKPPA
jgi:hypothetical protein